VGLTKWDLYSNYDLFMNSLAFRDIRKFLYTKKARALKKLRDAEDAEARATWKLVDEFYQHLLQVKKEGLEQYRQENNRAE
jgi:phage-related protein